MGEGMALALAGAGVARDRRRQPHRRAAPTSSPHRVGGRAITLDEIADALARVRRAPRLHRRARPPGRAQRDRGRCMARRAGRALLVVDIGVPRNIDPGAGEVFGVTLLDIDDLRALRRAVARASGARRSATCARSSPRSSTATASRTPPARSHRSSPRCAPTSTTSAPRELERHRASSTALDPAAREAVEQLTRSIVNKLLHEPTVRVKDAAGTARGERSTPTLSSSCSACSTRRRLPTTDAAPAPRGDTRQRAGAVAGAPRRHAAGRRRPSSVVV